MDCLQLQPENIKAMYRIAKAANQLAKYDLALQYAERALQLEPQNKQLQVERQAALDAIAKEQQLKLIVKTPTQQQVVQDLMEKRGIKVYI